MDLRTISERRSTRSCVFQSYRNSVSNVVNINPHGDSVLMQKVRAELALTNEDALLVFSG